MKNLKLLRLILVLFLYKECVSDEIDNINNLIINMTVEEKCGQISIIPVDFVTKNPIPTDPEENPLDYYSLEYAILTKKIGSIYYVPVDKALKASTWMKMIKLVQDIALNKSNGIPILYALDAVHGATYIREGIVFPQPLSVSATFNTEIAKRIGQISAFEMRSVGIMWNINQIYELGRQPLWSRLYETYGEDVYLACRLIESFIKGAQGECFGDSDKIATTMRHYIGYGYPLNGIDMSSVWIEEDILRELYLPSYETGIKEGVKIAIANSGEVNGIPGHINDYYINRILKQELNFDGFVVSNWIDIENLYTVEKIVESPDEALKMALLAGLDMVLIPFDYSFIDICVNITKNDEKILNRINDAVERILKVKKKLNIFKNPYPLTNNFKMIGSNESHKFNLEAARESIILVKNENELLPLNLSLRLLVTGPSGDLLKVFNGGHTYSWQGLEDEYYDQFKIKTYSIFESIRLKMVNVIYSEGATFTDLTNINETLNLCKNIDLIILCIGEDTYAEDGNIDNLSISESQSILAEKLAKTGKPMVVIYLGGRPRIITNIVNNARAVIIGFLPGNRGAEAIADILFGDYNPNGRLPITYPKSTNHLTTYDCKPIETYDYLFPFGHGLSYTQFKYSNLKLNTSIVYWSNGVSVSVKVKNSGKKFGKETVILYLNDEVASITRPNKQLKRFQKIFLDSNQEVIVNFELNFQDLSFIDKNNRRVIEDGYFNIYIGNLTVRFLVIGSSKH